MPGREEDGMGGRVGWRSREVKRNSNSNSKTLFSKDCSLGSFRPV